MDHPDADPTLPGGFAVHPAAARRIRRVPDDWTVWAFSDPHGVASGFEAALREAGLVDEALRWSAPPGTALVGCGDYVDRGLESRRLVQLLRRLTDEAAAAGGVVELARGNHEHLLVRLVAGASDDVAGWLKFGGGATLAAWELGGPEAAIPRTLREIDRSTPGALAWFTDLAHAVRWRDVLLVHGGLPPGATTADVGTATDDHLYIRSGFFDRAWADGAFAGYEADGIQRVVFGHTPQPYGDRLFHGGRSIALDTNACGNPDLPADARRMVTLLRLEGDAPFGDARRVIVPTDDAPDGVPRR